MSRPESPTDAELWLAGYELRTAHLPDGDSPECPICHTNWECVPYLTGLEMMRRATDVPPPPLGDRSGTG
ncbi:hypothetical protein [Cryptosporangium phraense]|uniref:Uncharacterized protein n=1 Tax=Cryptosporangium phraense TaxID=2593070 RepID=A0A545AM78_9ACTN|nr:hypothetical protein [Cryptosporangium phraense]TQS42432.1 hypothetical protein FL583_24300 [Cryptosporangium phraense]